MKKKRVEDFKGKKRKKPWFCFRMAFEMKPKWANLFVKNIITKPSLVNFYCLLQSSNSKLLIDVSG
jgi:hypothetical protein